MPISSPAYVPELRDAARLNRASLSETGSAMAIDISTH